jgi:SAM-dependent methyltransferase
MPTRAPSVTAVGVAVRRAIAAVASEPVRHGATLVDLMLPTRSPDRFVALERYRHLAPTYDVRTATGAGYRRRTVEHLGPARGEVILDVGCGTGLNFAALEDGIGPDGRLIALDPCTEMLERAQARIENHGWDNIELVHATAEDARVPAMADAALLCGVHDVMRSPAALVNVLRHIRDGGRIVAGGAKWAPWWRPESVAVNFSTWAMNREYVSTLEGFDRPWNHLAHLVSGLQVEELYFGGGYLARGVLFGDT